MNCCRNSRLLVNEVDLKWVANDNFVLLLLKRFHENVRSKTSFECKKISHSSVMQHDALWGLNPLAAKLFNWNFHPLEVVSR